MGKPKASRHDPVEEGLCLACVRERVQRPEWWVLVKDREWRGPPGGTGLEAGSLCVECLALRKRLWLPTMLVPGTDAKVALMEARVGVGLPPCHPCDLRLGTEEGGRRMLEVLRFVADAAELTEELFRRSTLKLLIGPEDVREKSQQDVATKSQHDAATKPLGER